MYHFGNSALTVKPVTRRTTFVRKQALKVGPRYLQKKGRRPLNRCAYPVMGTPIAADMALEPGHFAGVPDDAFSMKGLNTLGPTSRGEMVIAALTRSGRRILSRPYDPFSPVTLGASILDPISITSNYTPRIPSVVATPLPQSSGFWDLPAAVANLWASRPQVLKNIRIRVNPAKVAQAAGLTPAQVHTYVDRARAMGLDPSYQGVPITGAGASAVYRIAGMDLEQYLPWIAGGAVLLFVLPMLMKK